MISLLTGKQKSYVELPQFEKVQKVLHPYVPTTQSLKNKFQKFDEELQKQAMDRQQKLAEIQPTSRSGSTVGKSKSKTKTQGLRSVLRNTKTDLHNAAPPVSRFNPTRNQNHSSSGDQTTNRRQRLSRVIETNPSTARDRRTRTASIADKTSVEVSRVKYTSPEHKSVDSSGRVTQRVHGHSPQLSKIKPELQVVLQDDSNLSPSSDRVRAREIG